MDKPGPPPSTTTLKVVTNNFSSTLTSTAPLDALPIIGKAEARRLAKTFRANLSSEKEANLNAKIIQHTIKLLQDLDGGTISIFLSIPSKHEVDTTPILNYLASNHAYRTVVPVADFDSNNMHHTVYKHGITKLELDSYNIPTPQAPFSAVADQEIDIVLVPMLACDAQGNRVGYGKGFYDRFLANCRPSVQIIGINWEPPQAAIYQDAIATDMPIQQLVFPGGVIVFDNLA